MAGCLAHPANLSLGAKRDHLVTASPERNLTDHLGYFVSWRNIAFHSFNLATGRPACGSNRSSEPVQ